MKQLGNALNTKDDCRLPHNSGVGQRSLMRHSALSNAGSRSRYAATLLTASAANFGITI